MGKKFKLTIRHPVSIREKVYDVIRNDILNAHIAPGERVVETRLAEQIKTSRTPVREALHMLEREGLLEAIPRVGYLVKQITWDEIEEICEIRAVNECLAARWAMKRMTPKELQALEDNLCLSEAEVKQGNPSSFVEFDAEFHEILARASGSARLLELCQMLRRHMLRYRIESIFRKDNALRAIAGHKAIVACIKRKDQEGVEMAIKQHLEQSKRDIQRYAFNEQLEKESVSRG
ncbi:MAG: GntR family transcriptional regulator [Desulfobacterales bacterium]|nr:MAG: GntR family transcriptional regulator [Desulfobacterales bacterium]